MVDSNYDTTNQSNLPDKVSALKNLANSFDMKMRGFKMNTTNDQWIPAGEALAGSKVIDQGTGMITSFAEEVNLMTTKDKEKFLMEFTDAFFKFNVMILNDQATPQETHRAVAKIFKDTFSNIGDIITGSKSTYAKMFDNPDFQKEPRDYDV